MFTLQLLKIKPIFCNFVVILCFIFSPNDSPSIIMKNAFSSKKLSFSRCSCFCISVFSSFFPNPSLLQKMIQDKVHDIIQVYDIISCLNKNLKHILFDILRRKKGRALKLCQLTEYYIRNILMEKIMPKMYTKSQSQTPFNFCK